MNSSRRPILSICIGTYNRKKYLSELIHLILGYRGDEIEVVVCDNASTDGTWEMLEKITDKRLRSYRNEQNYGAAYNWFKSLLHGEGKFVMNLNDRTLLDMEELQRFVLDVKDINADAIVASGHSQSEYMNVKDYTNRVCLTYKLGEPGDIIYSGEKLKEYLKIYGKEIIIEKLMEQITKRCHIYYKSDNWYWYGRRLVKDRPMEVLKEIKVERKSNGYVFTGSVEGQLNCCLDMLRKTLYIEEQYRKDYCRGVIKAGARMVLWTVYRSINSKELCERYNYSPPKYVLWIKELHYWKKKIKECLMEQKCFDTEINKFLNQRCREEYIEFLYYRMSINKMVKLIVKIKHKIFGIPSKNGKNKRIS